MSSAEPSPSPERLVVCPGCKGPSVYAPRNPYRPFCSDRCKNIDLGAWANQEFSIAASPPPEDGLDPVDFNLPPAQ